MTYNIEGLNYLYYIKNYINIKNIYKNNNNKK